MVSAVISIMIGVAEDLPLGVEQDIIDTPRVYPNAIERLAESFPRFRKSLDKFQVEREDVPVKPLLIADAGRDKSVDFIQDDFVVVQPHDNATAALGAQIKSDKFLFSGH
jgi:hypothetical protein